MGNLPRRVGPSHGVLDRTQENKTTGVRVTISPLGPKRQLPLKQRLIQEPSAAKQQIKEHTANFLL